MGRTDIEISALLIKVLKKHTYSSFAFRLDSLNEREEVMMI